MKRLKGITKIDHLWQTVEVKAANYEVKASDTGKLLVGNKSGSGITFTLPEVDVCEGCTWFFQQMQDQNMTITGGTADKIVAKHNAAADSVAFSTGNQKIGAACMVISDGSRYYFFNLSSCTDSPTG